ncbi:RIP metalloprotease RseP [Erysipelothrix urinaevulpis]|uniref:RIP metalloprotease RseP n=1 Tax=Erysipelothrix urinaevulpis TaxID=2683717 RepID=UPI001357C52F|nr:RIP metalloprotease RseP [Erysipelothrix urinaevulpis]
MIFNILVFALVMGIIVLIHELGHLLAAKKFGVYCHEFAIGMGPVLFKLKKPEWETTYSIRAFPLGGFVAMAGEDAPVEDNIEVPEERTINGIKPWKRLIVMLAGVTMNFILAFLIFWGMSTYNGTVDMPKAEIATVQENSPAAEAGLQANDKFVEFNFHDGTHLKPKTFNEVFIALETYGQYGFDVTVDRQGETFTTTIHPERDEKDERYIMGITAPAGKHRDLTVFSAIPVALLEIKTVIVQFFFIITRLFRGIGLNNVGGPIGIFEVTSQVRTYGFLFFLNLVALLSVNLAVVNLLPIPVMDGGRAILTLIEMITGKPINKKLEEVIMMIGVVLIFALFIFIMLNDIRKLF